MSARNKPRGYQKDLERGIRTLGTKEKGEMDGFPALTMKKRDPCTRKKEGGIGKFTWQALVIVAGEVVR